MNEEHTLREGEYHPCADLADKYLRALGRLYLSRYLEIYASASISNNRLAALCGETLRRWLSREPVSDRYLLALAWNIKEMEEMNDTTVVYSR